MPRAGEVAVVSLDTFKVASNIPVGKAPRRHPVPQDQINEMLVSLARQGLTVVRLKENDARGQQLQRYPHLTCVP